MRGQRELEAYLSKALRTPHREDHKEETWLRIQERLADGPSSQQNRRPHIPFTSLSVAAAAALVCALAAGALIHLPPLDTAPATRPANAVRVPLSLSGVLFGESGSPLHPSQSGFVSPDGNWLLRASDVENLSGQTCPLPSDEPPGFYALYGTTPQGELILMSTVDGSVRVALNPNTHAITRFPLDAHSAETLEAARNRGGEWATVETNSTGAGPGVRSWVAVGGKAVAGLEFPDARIQLAWSPDGSTLAVVSRRNSTAEMDLYSTVKGQVVSHVEWPVDGRGGDRMDSPQLTWSPSGRYVAGMSGSTLVAYDTARGRFDSVDVGDAQWAWVPHQDTLCVLTGDSARDTAQANLYDAFDLHVTVSNAFQIDRRVAGIVPTDNGLVVETSDGRLVYVDQRNRTTVIGDHFKAWWYNADRDAVYFVDTGDASTLWRVSLASGGEHR